MHNPVRLPLPHAQTDPAREAEGPRTKSYSVHVRDVPAKIWQRARTNALLSGLPFKAYVTRLLAEGGPLSQPGQEAQAVPLPKNGNEPAPRGKDGTSAIPGCREADATQELRS